jgi:hypothetical protein
MIETASSSFRIFVRGRGLILFGFCMWIVVTVCAFAAAGSMERIQGEYDVKAAYLYYFAKFVEWPAQAFSQDNSPIIIGVAGDDPFGPILEKTVSGKTVQNRSILIHHPKTEDDLRSCHIVFIGSSEAGRTASIFENLKGRSTLTVCESEGTAQSKCIIYFVIEGGRVQFEVDDKKANKAGLKISSKLMMVSRGARPDAVKGRN